MMDKREAEQRAQELIDFYGSGKYKGYEEVTMPDGSPGVRVSGFVPTIKDMTMNTQERDTHFHGAAKLLWDKLLHVNEFGYIEISDDEEEENARYQQLITQFLYDLMGATVQYESTCIDIELYSGEVITLEECIRRIPDMTKLPEQCS